MSWSCQYPYRTVFMWLLYVPSSIRVIIHFRPVSSYQNSKNRAGPLPAGIDVSRARRNRVLYPVIRILLCESLFGSLLRLAIGPHLRNSVHCENSEERTELGPVWRHIKAESPQNSVSQ